MTDKTKARLKIAPKDLILSCLAAAYLLRMIMYGAGPDDAIAIVIVIAVAMALNTLAKNE